MRAAFVGLLLLIAQPALASPPANPSNYRDVAQIGAAGPLATTLRAGEKIKILYALRVSTVSPYRGIPPGAVAPAGELPTARFEFDGLSAEQLNELRALSAEESVCIGYWWVTFIRRENDMLNRFKLDGFDEVSCGGR